MCRYIFAATVLSELTKGNLSDFFSLLKSGDEEATSLWDDYLEHLAITANNVHMLFDCDISENILVII